MRDTTRTLAHRTDRIAAVRLLRTFTLCVLLAVGQLGVVAHGLSHFRADHTCSVQDVQDALGECPQDRQGSCDLCVAFAGVAAAAAPTISLPLLVSSDVAPRAVACSNTPRAIAIAFRARAPPAQVVG